MPFVEYNTTLKKYGGTIMSERELELVNFICEKCGKNLVQALPAARVLCKSCDHWVEHMPRGYGVYVGDDSRYSMSIVCKS